VISHRKRERECQVTKGNAEIVKIKENDYDRNTKQKEIKRVEKRGQKMQQAKMKKVQDD
jgi:hypothetical protein